MSERPEPVTVLDVVVFQTDRYRIGIEASEIRRIVARSSLEKKMERLEAIREAGRYHTLSALFGIPVSADPDAYLLVEKNEEDDCVIAAPAVDELLRVPLSQVLLPSELVSAWQRPRVVWGFYPTEHDLVMLVTFADVC